MKTNPHSTDTFYGILCSGLTTKTKLSFSSSNSSFTECVRKHKASLIQSYHGINNSDCSHYSAESQRCMYSHTHVEWSQRGEYLFEHSDFLECESESNGGAILVEGTEDTVDQITLQVTDCTFIRCVVRANAYPDSTGGAVCARLIRDATVSSSVFSFCSSPGGGAVMMKSLSHQPLVEHSSFISCVAPFDTDRGRLSSGTDADGAAIDIYTCFSIDPTVIRSCSLLCSHSDDGGGAVFLFRPVNSMGCNNILFSSGIGGSRGGGIALYFVQNSIDYPLRFCFFYNNKCNNSTEGHDVCLCDYPTSLTKVFLHCFSATKSTPRVGVEECILDKSDWLPQRNTNSYLPVSR